MYIYKKRRGHNNGIFQYQQRPYRSPFITQYPTPNPQLLHHSSIPSSLIKMKFLVILSAFSSLALADFGVNFYSDDSCQDEISSIACSSIYNSCTSIGGLAYSYQFINKETDCEIAEGTFQDMLFTS